MLRCKVEGFFPCWITSRSTAFLVLEAWMVYVDCYYMIWSWRELKTYQSLLDSSISRSVETLAPKINFWIFGWNFVLQQLLKNLPKIPARPKFLLEVNVNEQVIWNNCCFHWSLKHIYTSEGVSRRDTTVLKGHVLWE